MMYSVVIPIYNEEEVLPELYRRLKAVMDQLMAPYEVIFVDDGSQDRSFEVLRAFNKTDDRVRIIRFSRNFGHHIAILAGLDYARGNRVILMDGDLQDPPEEIPKLLKAYNEGYDVVYAIRSVRSDSFFKKFASKVFFRIFKLFTNILMPVDSGAFRIMSKQAVDAFVQCREQTRLTLGLMEWTGFSAIGVESIRSKRFAGKSKYTFFKSVRLALDGIISFSRFPLQIASYIGFCIALISFAGGIYIVVQKLFFGTALLGYTSLMVSVIFLGGVQLVLIGIIGEYIGRIYTEIQRRPAYIIKEVIDSEDHGLTKN
jgi:polyisoprenyl-phosphate glycosyltransferase